MVKGKCECGKVGFSVESLRKTVTVCHCSQCRRLSGHVWASTRAAYKDVHFSTDEGLQWYTSSDFAKRGFCKFCGSCLFFRLNGEDGIAIAAGCLESPTGLAVDRHIYLKDKGDYYEVSDPGIRQEQ